MYLACIIADTKGGLWEGGSLGGENRSGICPLECPPMRLRLFNSVVMTLISLTVLGCGSSFQDTLLSSPNGANPDQVGALEQAFLDDPDPGLQTVPTMHLDPLSTPQASNASVISVADLQRDYETIFCSLSSQLGVTKESPENVANIAFIKSQSGTGHFDLDAQPILNNPLGVTGVSFQALEYDTTVPLPGGNQSFHVSGGLLMPEGIDATQVKGVVVYFHGTTFDKSQVGSSYDNSVETQLNAQVFASQGYIVAIPDYVGQGVDWQTVHPYVLYPEVSAQTAVDMLTAIKPTLSNRFGFTATELPLKLFSTGYSEGGSYALWFNTYISENPSLLDALYQLTHSVGLEGAYSTSEVIYGYLFDDVSKRNNTYQIQSLSLTNFVKPILSADAFLSYATYSANSDFASVFNLDFFNMTTTSPIPQAAANVDGNQVNIASAFARPSTQIAPQLALAALGKTANGASYPGLAQVLISSKNSITPLVSPQILTQEFLDKLILQLEAADADLSNVANGGVSIVTLDQDSVVSPNDYDVLLAKFPSKIGTAIKIDHRQLLVVSPYSSVIGTAQWVAIDHLNGPAYQYLYALHIFNQF
jgi:hypothetical protein